MSSRDAFGGYAFAAFSSKKIPVVVTVIIKPSLIECSMFFFPIKVTHLLYRVFYHKVDSLDLKKDKNYTKDVDVSNASCCPTPTVINPKNIPLDMATTVLVSDQSPIGFLAAVVYGGSIINRFFIAFLAFTITHLLYRSFKDIKSFWCLFLFFIDRFFYF